ncbi:MAG: radical SAM protein [Theionarchaea archaeon]|nr:radical SAM protein [Theionarchaea archaeon]
MKVIVVDPATPDVGTVAPLGVLYVASVLEEAGNEVTIKLRSLSDDWESIGEYVQGEDPDLVGVPCVQSVNINRALNTVKKIRAFCDAPIMMGGIHPTMKYEEVLMECPEIDVIALYEAEYTATDIASALEHGEPLSHVKGIAYTDNGRVKVTEERPFVTDLDSIPFPARHLVPMEKFEPDSRGNMITSRGCPYACAFCCVSRMHGTAFRARTPLNIVKEIKELEDKYDVYYSKFVDDTFSYSLPRVIELCNLLIEESLDHTWGCNTRADRVTSALLRKMKEAGCVDIYFGIESISQKILDIVGKKETTTQVEKAIKLSQEMGIKVTGSIVIGLPFETKQEILETLEFAENLHLDRLGIQVLVPHPGCEIYENLEEYGITLLNEDYTLQNQVTPVIETTELTKEDIIELAMKAVEISRALRAKTL